MSEFDTDDFTDYLDHFASMNDAQAKELAEFLVKHWERSMIREHDLHLSQSRLQKLISFLEKEIRQSEREQHMSERSRRLLKWIHKSKEGDLLGTQWSENRVSSRREQLPLLHAQLASLRLVRDFNMAQLQEHGARQLKLKEITGKWIPQFKRFAVTVPHPPHLISA
jgi:hypothetical protein